MAKTESISVVDLAEIRRRREAQQLTLAEAGIRADQQPKYARQWWYDLETGRSPDPVISKIAAAARALRCRVDDLLLEEFRTTAARR